MLMPDIKTYIQHHKLFVILLLAIILVGVVSIIFINQQAQKTITGFLLQNREISRSFSITLASRDYQISEKDKEGFQTIKMTDFENLEIPGEPNLPTNVFPILLPPGAKFRSIEIISKEAEKIKGIYKIKEAPTPQPIAALEENTNSDLDYQPVPVVPAKPEIYQSDAIYPSKIIEKGHSGQMRKYSVQEINFNPIQYQPLSGKLNLIKNVVVKINYLPGPKPENKVLSDRIMDQEAKELFINYDQFKDEYKVVTPPKGSLYHYVIIAPQTLAESEGMTDLIQYRQNQGYLVHLETIEHISSNYSGTDLPEEIRNYLIDHYLDWGFKYVALVGTHDVIPMRYCSSTLPNDYYYQDLTGEWDSEQSFCGPNADFYPEVYVGRIPLEETTQLESYIDRVINYEGSDDPYKEDVLLAAGIWGIYCDAAYTAEYLRDNVFLPNDYQTVRMYEETGDCPCTLPHDYDVSQENVVSHWRNDHYGIVYLAAHGIPARVFSKPCPQPEQGCQTIFHRDDTLQLNNNYPSIVFGSACNTAYPEDPNNLGYSLVRQGGISYTGTVRNGTTVDRVYKYYFENLVNKKQTNGKALAGARLEVASPYKYQALNYNLYSEPLLTLSPYNLGIANPEDNQVVDKVYTVGIEGSVLGPEFSHYLIEWGQGENPSTWSTEGIVLEDGGTQIKLEELLGTWDISGITTADDYTLRLTGYFADATYSYNVTFYLEPYSVEITSPEGDPNPRQVFVNPDTIKIEGTVFGPNFDHYVLKWGQGENPPSWSSNGIVLEDGGNQIKVEELLGTWDIPRITIPGDYTLKLTGYFATGTYTYNVTFHLTIYIIWGSRYFVPRGVTVNNNRVYVADTYSDSIQVFDLEGNLFRLFGSYGGGDGEFVDPYSIAVKYNRVYVTDAGNNRIQVFDTDGDFIRKWGSRGSGDGEFLLPHYIAVNNNEVYVVDTGNQRIQVFNLEGNFLRKWGSYGLGDGYFNCPQGIEIYNNEVYIVDTNNHRIQVFDVNGNFIRKWGSFGSGSGEFYYPRGIAINNDRVYIADTYNNRIQVFDTSGNFIKKLGSIGPGEGEFNYPRDIAVSNDRVYVADTNNHRIQSWFICPDGTPYYQCNNEGQYCDGGVLINNCSKCGCSSGSCCEETTNLCSSTCLDGTALRECSDNKPKYCGLNPEGGTDYCSLFDYCSKCGCPEVQDVNGTPKYICKKTHEHPAGGCYLSPDYCDSNKVLYFPFSRPSIEDIAYDSTCYHNDGEIVGAEWEEVSSMPIDYALSFDGDEDRVVVDDSNSLDVSEEITISARIKFNEDLNSAPSTCGTIVKKESAYILRFSKNPVRLQGILFTDTPGIHSIFSNKTDWIVDQWYHIVFTYDRNSMKLYINGVLDKSESLPDNNIRDSSEKLSIGNGYDPYDPPGWHEGFPGVIDEVKIYPTADTLEVPTQPQL